MRHPEVQRAAAEYLRLQQHRRAGADRLVLVAGHRWRCWWVRARITPELRARNAVEAIGEKALLACSLAGGIRDRRHRAVGGVRVDPVLPRGAGAANSCSALSWSPQTALRADQVGSSGSFGAVPLFLGTLMISGIAMLIAVPVGLFSAIYLAEYANRGSAPGPSRCWRSWPAFPRWCTASSRR